MRLISRESRETITEATTKENAEPRRKYSGNINNQNATYGTLNYRARTPDFRQPGRALTKTPLKSELFNHSARAAYSLKILLRALCMELHTGTRCSWHPTSFHRMRPATAALDTIPYRVYCSHSSISATAPSATREPIIGQDEAKPPHPDILFLSRNGEREKIANCRNGGGPIQGVFLSTGWRKGGDVNTTYAVRRRRGEWDKYTLSPAVPRRDILQHHLQRLHSSTRCTASTPTRRSRLSQKILRSRDTLF